MSHFLSPPDTAAELPVFPGISIAYFAPQEQHLFARRERKKPQSVIYPGTFGQISVFVKTPFVDLHKAVFSILTVPLNLSRVVDYK
jgi:hypothetical protein